METVARVFTLYGKILFILNAKQRMCCFSIIVHIGICEKGRWFFFFFFCYCYVKNIWLYDKFVLWNLFSFKQKSFILWVQRNSSFWTVQLLLSKTDSIFVHTKFRAYLRPAQFLYFHQNYSEKNHDFNFFSSRIQTSKIN